MTRASTAVLHMLCLTVLGCVVGTIRAESAESSRMSESQRTELIIRIVSQPDVSGLQGAYAQCPDEAKMTQEIAQRVREQKQKAQRAAASAAYWQRYTEITRAYLIARCQAGAIALENHLRKLTSLLAEGSDTQLRQLSEQNTPSQSTSFEQLVPSYSSLIMRFVMEQGRIALDASRRYIQDIQMLDAQFP